VTKSVPLDFGLSRCDNKREERAKLASPKDAPEERNRDMKRPAKPRENLKRQSETSFDLNAFVTQANGGRTVRKYGENQAVFTQGDPADSVFYIQKGKIKLTVVSERGKEAVVGILEPSHFFGEGCLNGHPLRVTTATAVEQSLLTRITKAAMIATLHDEVGFSELFMAVLNRNSRIEEDLIDQLFNSSEKRLARLLIMLAQVGKEAELRTVSAPISQEVMAARVGTTRSRINYFMNKFRKLGLIEYNGKLKVHSSLLNVIIRE
jgi:CRP-like cAMP-binding protein